MKKKKKMKLNKIIILNLKMLKKKILYVIAILVAINYFLFNKYDIKKTKFITSSKKSYDILNDFDFKHYCFDKNIAWKWKPLSLIYKNLKDQQDFLKAEFKLLIQGYKRENNISFFVQNFKNQFDLRSK
jgi:hypothetical protein